MEFGVLGPLRVITDDGRPVTAPGQRRLLGLLLTRPNEPVAADVLADALWPDHTGNLSRLHLLVHKTRRSLGAVDRIGFEHGTYRLRVRPGELDAERFEALCGRVDDPDKRVDRLREGLRLWRGEPWADLGDLPGLASDAARLTARRFAALERLYAAEIGLGRSADVVAELGELAAAHPTRERFTVLLMVALQRFGRQADALDVYHTASRHLAEELGIEPGTELRRVHRSILAGESPALDDEPIVRVVPAQLPRDIARFTGRRAELTRLDEALADDSGIVVISGPAGTGKTALAVYWANRARERFPDGQLFVNLHGFSPTAPFDTCTTLGMLLGALGVTADQVPAGGDERLTLLKSIMDGRRMLLVLDNARDAEQVRRLLPGRTTFVLITSRNRLAGLSIREGARRITLDRLPGDDAIELLTRSIGRDRTLAEPDAAERLVRACDRLPLALAVAAERFAERPDVPLADFVAELSDADQRLDALDVGDELTDVRSVFSWSYQALDADPARVFRLAATMPGGDFSAAAAAAVTGLPVDRATYALHTLVNASLLDRRVDGRYEYHDLVRAYAIERAGEHDTGPDRDAALRRLLGWLTHTAKNARSVIQPNSLVLPLATTPPPDAPPLEFATIADARAWETAEAAAFLPTLTYAAHRGWHHDVAELALSLWSYYYYRGLLTHEWITAAGLAFESAVECGHTHAAGFAASGLGNAWLRRGALDEAEKWFRREFKLFDGIGYRDGLFTSLTYLGITARRAGRNDDALASHRKALGIAEAQGSDFLQAVALNNMSVAYSALGDFATAVRTAERALDHHEAADSPTHRAHALDSLATACRGLGETTRAIEACERALEINTELEALDNQTYNLRTLGALFKDLGRIDEARHALNRMLKIIGDNPDPRIGEIRRELAALAAPGTG